MVSCSSTSQYEQTQQPVVAALTEKGRQDPPVMKLSPCVEAAEKHRRQHEASGCWCGCYYPPPRWLRGRWSCTAGWMCVSRAGSDPGRGTGRPGKRFPTGSADERGKARQLKHWRCQRCSLCLQGWDCPPPCCRGLQGFLLWGTRGAERQRKGCWSERAKWSQTYDLTVAG